MGFSDSIERKTIRLILTGDVMYNFRLINE